MNIYTTQRSSLYRSPFEVWNGDHDEHHEVPERVETILQAVSTREEHSVIEVTDTLPRSLVERVHDVNYIEYIQQTSDALKKGEYRYPSVFSLRDGESTPTNVLALQGYYSFDMYTPLLSETFRAAVGSASLAWRLATDIHQGNNRVGYALCRPPGHHAEKSQMGGYCYLNNNAIAAEYLSEFGKVVVLDVDFHHGNGTQHIFYERDDVLTLSLHADPSWKFPHFSGYQSEVGRNSGEGFNHNYPLIQGTTNEQFQHVLEQALQRIQDFHPQFLVVAFGADTFVGDPIGGFALTTEYFQEMARTIDSLRLPTVIVQEGGYNCEELGENVVSFLSGFEE